MKVKELIEYLQRCDQELEVYGYCDHGQSPEKVSAPGVIWIEGDVHTIWDGEWQSSSQEAKAAGFKHKAILL